MYVHIVYLSLIDNNMLNWTKRNYIWGDNLFRQIARSKLASIWTDLMGPIPLLTHVSDIDTGYIGTVKYHFHITPHSSPGSKHMNFLSGVHFLDPNIAQSNIEDI